VLPAYDVRGRRERAQRRLLLSLSRRLLRVGILHVMDAAVILGSALAAGPVAGFDEAAKMAPALVALVLIALNLTLSYRPGQARRSNRRIAAGVLLGAAPLATTALLPPRFPVSLPFLGAFAALAVAALIAERHAFDLLVREAHVRGIGLRRAMIVGRRAQVDDLVAAITEQNDDQHIVGFVSPHRVHEEGALGTIEHIEPLLDHHDPDDLVLAGGLAQPLMKLVADACFKRGVRLLVLPAPDRPPKSWAEPIRLGPLAGYHVHPVRLAMPGLALKRLCDLALGSVAVVLSVPVMLVIAIAIKLDSDGPVFFRQSRVGLGGREFKMWKFRSMSLAAEEQQDTMARLSTYNDGRLFKIPDDPRVTRVGRVLRRFSLDELPQVFNVLRGEMSLVGPRPPVPAEVRRYESRHYVRLTVVPGMTGPWQVNGRNLVTDFEEVVKLERGYIESWSFRRDLEIMARTVGVVLSGKGAY
jgi:exopolysaccharide biosynthesis polyprenyl glycosylphosphotransferase